MRKARAKKRQEEGKSRRANRDELDSATEPCDSFVNNSADCDGFFDEESVEGDAASLAGCEHGLLAEEALWPFEEEDVVDHDFGQEYEPEQGVEPPLVGRLEAASARAEAEADADDAPDATCADAEDAPDATCEGEGAATQGEGKGKPNTALDPNTMSIHTDMHRGYTL